MKRVYIFIHPIVHVQVDEEDPTKSLPISRMETLVASPGKYELIQPDRWTFQSTLFVQYTLKVFCFKY